MTIFSMGLALGGTASPGLYGLPSGYSWSTSKGSHLTYLGRPVFDDGRTFFVGA